MSNAKLKEIAPISRQEEESAGKVLRNELYNRLTPLLLLSDAVSDSSTRLLLQASCLDMVSSVEDLISRLELDSPESTSLNSRPQHSS